VQVQLISDRIIDYARSCMNNAMRVSPFESMTRTLQPKH